MNAQLSQIYPALKSMTESNLLRYEEEITEGGRATKRYFITEEGDKSLVECLRTPINYSLSMNIQRIFMLRVSFIGLLPREEQISFLKDALDYFRFERNELMGEYITPEGTFLDTSMAQFNDVMMFWESELEYLLDAHDRLVLWIEKLLITLEADEQ
ncbi:MAG: PadR family transcriptional regulator [Anaerotardibacter sp.]